MGLFGLSLLLALSHPWRTIHDCVDVVLIAYKVEERRAFYGLVWAEVATHIHHTYTKPQRLLPTATKNWKLTERHCVFDERRSCVCSFLIGNKCCAHMGICMSMVYIRNWQVNTRSHVLRCDTNIGKSVVIDVIGVIWLFAWFRWMIKRASHWTELYPPAPLRPLLYYSITRC